jgi:hypothetical protein
MVSTKPVGVHTLRSMPVEFLTDDEAAAYGRYAGAPSQADLERVFFLDDDDRALAGRHRGEHMSVALGPATPRGATGWAATGRTSGSRSATLQPGTMTSLDA